MGHSFFLFFLVFSTKYSSIRERTLLCVYYSLYIAPEHIHIVKGRLVWMNGARPWPNYEIKIPQNTIRTRQIYSATSKSRTKIVSYYSPTSNSRRGNTFVTSPVTSSGNFPDSAIYSRIRLHKRIGAKEGAFFPPLSVRRRLCNCSVLVALRAICIPYLSSSNYWKWNERGKKKLIKMLKSTLKIPP